MSKFIVPALAALIAVAPMAASAGQVGNVRLEPVAVADQAAAPLLFGAGAGTAVAVGAVAGVALVALALSDSGDSDDATTTTSGTENHSN